MNKSILLYLATFILGAVSGSLITNELVKKKYAEIAEEEISSVKEAFEHDKVIVTNANPKSRIAYADEVIKEDLGVKSPGAVLSRSSLDGVRINPYEQAKKNYSTMYSDGKSVLKIEPEPEGAPDDEDEGDIIKDGEGTITAEDVAGDPYVIDDEEYSNGFPHHDKLSLYYYQLDDVLCEENEDIIDDIETSVGYAALRVLDMQTMVWVRNERLGVDYEIISLKKSYGEDVHGIVKEPPHEKKRRATDE